MILIFIWFIREGGPNKEGFYVRFEVLWIMPPCILVQMSYGAEAWTLTKKEEQALLIFERKIFRIIYGAKYEKREWKSRMNRELEEMSKGENIVNG